MLKRIMPLAAVFAVLLLGSGCSFFRGGADWRARAADLAREVEFAVHGGADADGPVALADGATAADGATSATAAGDPTAVLRAMAFSRPEMYDAVLARRRRLASLTDLKSAGLVGENNLGLLAPPEGLPEVGPRVRAEVARTVDAENADRLRIYERAAAELRRRRVRDLTAIRQAWADALREQARAGEMFQAPREEGNYARFLESPVGRHLVQPPLPGEWGPMLKREGR